MPRPSKRTPAVEAKILEALRAGNTRHAASQYAGIDLHTLARWIERYANFANAIKKAEADAEVRHVANIAQAAQNGAWQASAWWLERRYPEEWGRQHRIEVTLRQSAERLATQLGLTADEVIAEAERILHDS